MATDILKLTVFICIFGITVTKSVHKRSIPDSVYINLVSALCIEDDGSVRDACLQNLSTNLIQAIYSNVNDYENRSRKTGINQDTDLTSLLMQRASNPDKRGRSKSSGFYSNW